jgi:succinate dehydrogenase hydrophobic anchor subunit
MRTTQTAQSPKAPQMAQTLPAKQVRTVPRRALNLEYVMWVFTRLSGAALIILGLIGMMGGLYLGARLQMDMATLMRWTFFPNPNHVVNSNIPDVNLGWTSMYWQVMQVLIVLFGVTHGFNGLRVVIEDYVRNKRVQWVLRAVIAVLWVGVLFVAFSIIVAS